MSWGKHALQSLALDEAQHSNDVVIAGPDIPIISNQSKRTFRPNAMNNNY
jgi:hypothetical protein